MRARVGDLAIARFDPDDKDVKAGRRWCEFVCLVTGTTRYGGDGPRHYEFIYWNSGTNMNDIIQDSLPPNRLVRVRPKFNTWNGELSSLTPSRVNRVGRVTKDSNKLLSWNYAL